jgi:hypothetical protein
VPGIKGNVDVNIYNGDFQRCNLLPYNRSCLLVKYFGRLNFHYRCSWSAIRFNLLGEKAQKGFPLPSREKKKAIKSRFFKYYEVLQNEKPSFNKK